MKAVLLDGSPDGHQLPGGIRQGLIDEMTNRGWTVNPVALASTQIAACRGSFSCWTKTPGTCSCADDGRTVAEMVIGSDAVVLLTRVTFGGYSSHLKKALDRLLPLLSPFFMLVDGETRYQPRYGRYPALIGVGVHPEPDEGMETLFRTLVSRNALNLHAPAHAACFFDSSLPIASIRTQFARILAQVTTERAGAR